MPSFPFPMKSKRFKIILLAFHLGLLAAVIGCATRSEAPATEGPATQSGQSADAGWAFADTQSRDETAPHAKAPAPQETHAEFAKGAEAWRGEGVRDPCGIRSIRAIRERSSHPRRAHLQPGVSA